MQAQGAVGMREWFITVTVRFSVMVNVNIGVFIDSVQTLLTALWWVLFTVKVRTSFRLSSALGDYI